MDGNEMRERRREVGLRQLEVAAELGVSAETVNRWERGKVGISRSVETAFLVLVGDEGRVVGIKGGRKARRARERV